MTAKHFSTKLLLYPAVALLAALTATAQMPAGGAGDGGYRAHLVAIENLDP